MTINGRAMASVALGSLFVWSGIRGWSLLGTVGDLVTGKAPQQSEVNILTNPNATDGLGGNLSGATAVASQIASTALQYQGHGYRFGGAPGPNGQNDWDCSSFCNYVIGRQLGLDIPGISAGVYDGNSHGPPTGMWGIWSGLTHIKREEVQAGDLIVWLDHMGIAVSNDHMISALNPSEGTRVTPIDGYGNGPILCYGRYGRYAHGPKFN